MITYNNTFDILPYEVIEKVIHFVGKEYLGIGAVDRRLNKIFKDSDTPNKTSYGGYASFQQMIEQFDSSIDYENEIDNPDICYHIATGIAYYDRTDLLEWAIRNQNKFINFEILHKASRYGKLRVLRKVYGISDEESREYIKRYSEECTEVAAEHGHLVCLIFLHENGFKWNSDACSGAANNGHIECLKYLHEHGCPLKPSACEGAAEGGELDCLQYLLKHGCECTAEACAEAASNGHLDCLKCVHEHGCEWNVEVCYKAAFHGHLDCLKYLHEHGCEWDSYACVRAAEGGKSDCLQYLLKHGCPLDSSACEGAARGGKLDCLQYLLKHGCECTSKACKWAAYYGNLDCLKYLHEHGLYQKQAANENEEENEDSDTDKESVTKPFNNSNVNELPADLRMDENSSDEDDDDDDNNINNSKKNAVLETYLDPLADKIFLNTLGLSLTYQQIIPMWTFGIWAFKDFGLMITTYWWVKKHTPTRTKRTEDPSTAKDKDSSSSHNTIVVNPAITPLKVQPTLISKINTVLQFNTLGVGMIVGGLANNTTSTTKTDDPSVTVVEENGSSDILTTIQIQQGSANEVLDNAITILQNNADIAANTLTGLCYLTAFTTILSCFSYIGGGSLVSSGNNMSKEQNNK